MTDDIFYSIINFVILATEDDKDIKMTDAIIDACYFKEVELSEFIEMFKEAKETGNVSDNLQSLLEKDAIKNGQLKSIHYDNNNEF